MSSSHSNPPSRPESNAVPTCRDCIEFLIDYLEGTLPPAKRVEFELHLELCPPCHEYLRQYQATVRLGQAAMREQAAKNPPPEALIRAILAAKSGATPGGARPGSSGQGKEGGKASGHGCCGGDCGC